MNQGNVLFIILIAVLLFAALSYAITSSSSTGSTSISREKARAYASSVIQYNTSLRQTVMRLKLGHNCSDTTLSVTNNIYKTNSGAALNPTPNSSAPANKSCHLFDAAGGALAAVVPPAGALDLKTPLGAADWLPGHIIFRVVQMKGVGTDGVGGTASANDLIGLQNFINKDTCMAINDILGVPNAGDQPPTITLTGTNPIYTGTFATATGIIDGPLTNSYPAFCRWVPTTGTYQNISTLIER